MIKKAKVDNPADTILIDRERINVILARRGKHKGKRYRHFDHDGSALPGFYPPNVQQVL